MKMSDSHLRLAQSIRELAAAIPYELAETLVVAFMNLEDTDLPSTRTRVLNQVSNPNLRARISHVFDLAAQQPQITPASLGLALKTAAESEQTHRQAPLLELVWTGPVSRVIPLRRTEQALLQLIRESSERLLIVSFAVYKIPTIANALAEVARKDIQITLCLETDRASEGKVAYDTLREFVPQVADKATILIWPLAQRERNLDGKYGSLHAKVAVADGRTMFLSSANLTDYAMNLNIELGILIRGSSLPAQVEKHFQELANRGVLVSINDTET